MAIKERKTSGGWRRTELRKSSRSRTACQGSLAWSFLSYVGRAATNVVVLSQLCLRPCRAQSLPLLFSWTWIFSQLRSPPSGLGDEPSNISIADRLSGHKISSVLFAALACLLRQTSAALACSYSHVTSSRERHKPSEPYEGGDLGIFSAIISATGRRPGNL